MSRREPTVSARRSFSGRQLVVESCPFCGRQHWHGRSHDPATGCTATAVHGVCTCPVGQGDGWRASHCIDRPKGSYRLEEVPAPLRPPRSGPAVGGHPSAARGRTQSSSAPPGSDRPVPAIRGSDRVLYVRCPFCAGQHRHTAGVELGGSDGHRVAPCRDGGNYVVIEVLPSTPAAIGEELAKALGIDGPLDTFEAHHEALHEASPAQLDEALAELLPRTGRALRRVNQITR